MITDTQVKLLRQKMKQGKSQKSAAAAAGMSEKTARKWKAGPLPSQFKQPRSWRTRSDPFEDVWETEVVPLLKRDTKRELQARTILNTLIDSHSEHFQASHLRTLQRRIREWRAKEGPDKEVYFPQNHPPGLEGALDFTCCNQLGVTIQGAPFRHLFFEFVLVHSGWMWANLARSETFEALASGLIRALWALGGVPPQVVLDNMSAATYELKRGQGRRSLNKRFDDLRLSLGIEKVRRINPGKSNENGASEVRHRVTKSLVSQALILRGHRDFRSEQEYESFVQCTLEETHNRGCREKLESERVRLGSLPKTRPPDYSEQLVKVRKWSTIRVRARSYSVPSRLIGHQVKVRLFQDHLEVHYLDKIVESIPRVHGTREALINYRHVIHSLVRKPGAFARYCYREELFPSLSFRRAYDSLVASHGTRADVEYVRILQLAADTTESEISQILEDLIQENATLSFVTVQKRSGQCIPEEPTLKPLKPNLESYDALIGGQS